MYIVSKTIYTLLMSIYLHLPWDFTRWTYQLKPGSFPDETHGSRAVLHNAQWYERSWPGLLCVLSGLFSCLFLEANHVFDTTDTVFIIAFYFLCTIPPTCLSVTHASTVPFPFARQLISLSDTNAGNDKTFCTEFHNPTRHGSCTVSSDESHEYHIISSLSQIYRQFVQSGLMQGFLANSTF